MARPLQYRTWRRLTEAVDKAPSDRERVTALWLEGIAWTAWREMAQQERLCLLCSDRCAEGLGGFCDRCA